MRVVLLQGVRSWHLQIPAHTKRNAQGLTKSGSNCRISFVSQYSVLRHREEQDEQAFVGSSLVRQETKNSVLTSLYCACIQGAIDTHCHRSV